MKMKALWSHEMLGTTEPTAQQNILDNLNLQQCHGKKLKPYMLPFYSHCLIKWRWIPHTPQYHFYQIHSHYLTHSAFLTSISISVTNMKIICAASRWLTSFLCSVFLTCTKGNTRKIALIDKHLTSTRLMLLRLCWILQNFIFKPSLEAQATSSSSMVLLKLIFWMLSKLIFFSMLFSNLL